MHSEELHSVIADSAPEAGIPRGLRVLQVIYHDPANYPPTLNAARVLGNAQAEVLCLAFDRGNSSQLALPPSARIEYLNAGRPGYPRSLPGRLAELREFRGQIAARAARFRPHLVIAYDHLGGWAVLPLARSYPSVLHLHDLVDPATKALSTGGLAWLLVRRRVRAFRSVVVPERARGEYLETVLPKRHPPIHVVTNSPLRTQPQRNGALRELLPGVGTNPLAVVVGTMGMPTETVRALASARRAWHLVVIGCLHAPTVQAMEHEAARCGIRERLHVLPYADYDRMREWLPGCDLGFALYEANRNVNWRFMGTGSVKVQEYMAAGLPTVASTHEAFAKLASDTGALTVLARPSVDSIRQALDELDPAGARWAAMAQAASAAHLDRYNYEHQLGAWLEELGLGTARGADA